MNEDQSAAPSASLTLVGLAWRMSALTLYALVVGYSFENWMRWSPPAAFAALLFLPLLLSLVFQRINTWTPLKPIAFLGNLCLACLMGSSLVPFVANILFSQAGQPLPSSQGVTAIIIAVLQWITVALLALYTLVLSATLFVAFANRLEQNAN